jgi:hypothetical protein
MPWSPVARPSAPRRAGASAPARALAAGVAVLALAGAPAARAQTPVTLTFNSLTDVDGSGVRNVNNCYVESGIRVTVLGVACGTEAALATWTPDSPLFYTGSPALFNNLGPSVEFAVVSGAAFSFQSIGLAPLLGGFGNPATVMFTGFMMGGGTVMQTVQVPGATTALTPYTFTNFTNLSSLRMTVTSPSFEPYVQFDNVGLNVVPEPATVALFGAGLLGAGALARRRRRAA